jgi:hypothetical protein
MLGLGTPGYWTGLRRSLDSGSEKPGLRMDLIEERRLGCVEWIFWEPDSEREGNGSISVAEKERFREGERKEFGDREDRFWVGEG